MNSNVLFNMLIERERLLSTLNSYLYVGLDTSNIIKELKILEIEIVVYIRCCMKYGNK